MKLSELYLREADQAPTVMKAKALYNKSLKFRRLERFQESTRKKLKDIGYTITEEPNDGFRINEICIFYPKNDKVYLLKEEKTKIAGHRYIVEHLMSNPKAHCTPATIWKRK